MIVRLLIKWGLPLLAALTVMSVADAASAQACPDECPPPPCDTDCPPPPPPPCDIDCPPPPCDDGCVPPTPPCEYNCTNIDINVNANAEASAFARSQARVDSFAAGRGTGAGAGLGAGSGMGRGYASFGVQAPAPTAMSGFVVQGPARVVRVPYRAQRSMMSRVTIQAVCMDSRSVPHPASRVRPDAQIDDSYDGELYRCIAGSWLQITMSNFESSGGSSDAWCFGASGYQQSSYQREDYAQGSYSQGGYGGGSSGGYAQGSASGGAQGGGYGRFQCRDGAPPDCVRAAQDGFEMPGFCLTGGGNGGGNVMTCRQGEALWHNNGGRLECRPQTPQRDCFERSLLRRYGAGTFVLTMMREESYEEWREETVVESYSGMSVVFDGGVGGRVY